MSDSFNNDLFGAKGKNRGAGKEFLIVGLGASAGGIRALKEFFAQVPADSGMAYVVILHLSPDHESQLAEVLQATSAIPVSQVRDRVKVAPNHVYVISPNQSLAMTDGHLALSEMTRIEERRAPVDIFFRTLAESHHSCAVSVVLSGTGANGSMGMKRVKECGGVCIVQDPLEAEFPEMPRNSIATGLVDYVLPVAQIPAKIIAYKNHLGSVSIPVEARPEADDKALRDIFTQLRMRTGHDFTNYKRTTVLRRIERRISVHELPNLPAYALYLREQPEEAQALLKDLLISVTNFFRDQAAFEALERKIIPRLFEGKGPEDQVRVWVAGCATGEEAYSVAMLLAEHLSDSADAPGVQVFATDIDEWAIAKAREGYYTLNDAADVSPERLRRFFVKEGEGYRVCREIREMVLFAVHNLIKDPPFSHLDLVTCRNLLIYLNRTAQEHIMEVIHFALNPGGHLFIGTSESVEGASDLFVAFDKESHIFQGRPVETRLPLPIPSLSITSQVLQYRADARAPEARALERLSYLDLHLRLLELYGPPSVLVNEEYDIIHLSQRAGRYMEVAGGEPSHNLLKLIRPELRLELRTALYQATQKGQNVEARGLQIRVNGHTERVNLLVRPVMGVENATRGFILVLFEREQNGVDAEGGAPKTVVSADAGPMARQLEDELMRVKTQLHATSEQHELQQEAMKASNEELQAMNEELRSAAEELETSKEELQSVNEELTTVNQELKIKIEEQSQANNDIHNLINSTDIGTIFLDRAMRIKLFTPRAREIFNLIPADAGRSLSDITSRLGEVDLIPVVDLALDHLQMIEREVATQDGGWYLMRALPYRTTDDRIEGVVLTFTDITARKQAGEIKHQYEQRLRRAVEIETVGITFIKTDGQITDANDAFLRMSGYSRQDLEEGRVRWDTMTPLEWMKDSLKAIAELEETGRTNPYEKEYIRKDGSRWWGLFSASRLGEYEGVEFIVDVTERKQVEEALEQTRKELEQKGGERMRQLGETNEALQKEVAERKQLEHVRRELVGQLVTAQEVERRKIARDLHDQLGQQLTALRLQLEILRGRIVEDAKAFEQIEAIQTTARRIESDIDFLAWELRPLTLDDVGLPAAISDHVQRWSQHVGIPVEFHSTGLDHQRLAPEIETNLYRITQEALNNVQKHAQASRVEVLLERRDSAVVLIIEDNGVGGVPPPTPSASTGMGLLGMRERAALVGGTIEMESAPNEGTTIFVRIPAVFVNEGEA
jgi:two-component system CheB/CheR fusion protein